MAGDDELLGLLGQALATEAREPSTERVAALRWRVVERGSRPRPVTPPARSRRPAWALAAAAAVVLALTLGAATGLGPGRPGGGAAVEFDAALRTAAGGRAQVTGTKVGIGRLVHLRSDDLPILPKGEFYEVWFVGPGDRPGAPNRISAGTFHPDAEGRTDVELTAAVDPTAYPEVSVTAELGDGDPGPSGTEVLRSPVRLR